MVRSPRVVISVSPTSLNSNGSNTVAITRSEPNNPNSTTFVQADSSTFKEIVQMLTGAPESVTRRHDPTRNNSIPIPPMRSGSSVRKSASSRLYERRNSFKNHKMGPLGQARPGFHSGWTRPGTPEVLSPSVLEFPQLTLSSPVTPLIPDPFKRGVDEDKLAIKENGFHLRESEQPRLLTLFPLTSPRAGEGSSSEITYNGAADS